MKEFKKEKNLFICEECQRTFVKIDGLSKHIRLNHYSQKTYYDKWLKENDENTCKICKKETTFIGLGKGYKNCCSSDCTKKFRTHKIQATLLLRYGVNSPTKDKTIREKVNKTMIKKYGHKCPMKNEKIQKEIKQNNLKKLEVEYPFQSLKIQEKIIISNLENFGVKNTFQRIDVKNKIKETCMQRYGVENPNNNKKVRDKIEKTCIDKYGVKNPSQNKEVHDKQQKNACYSKKYKNTIINYRASYEYDFLEKFYPVYSDIVNGPTIKYQYKNESRLYFPDFYIPSLNLIVEIKNSYLLKKDKEKIEAKKKYTILNGYNYLIITNKDYSTFSSYLKISPV